MNNLQKVAQEILIVLIKSKKFPSELIGDPLVISVVVAIIVAIIRLYIFCKYSEKQAVEKSANPGLFGRIYLRKTIKKEIKKYKKIQDYLEHLELAFLIVGKTLTEKNFEELYKEVKEI